MKTRLFASLLLATSFTLIAADIERVEPPFWWAGMEHNELQLLVKGPGVGRLSAKIDYPGASIVGTTTPTNENYLFIDLVLESRVKPGSITLGFYDGDERVASHSYEILPREPGSANRQGFSPKDVIYLITPDRFANGNPANDESEDTQEGLDRTAVGGRHGGDIQGVADHLDYIADMGFTQIWLNPVTENNMPSYSYHGYAATDFYRVDPRYGSNQEYKSLAKRAKDKGIGLIMDVVLNHSGSEHWWMKDLPSADWTNNNNQFVQTTHKREALHDPHGTELDRRGFADGWFVPTMPDLNQKNPLMATYLIQNSIWWVEFAGLSGIRVDTYSYPDKDFLAQWTRRVMAEYPNFNIVGEEWSTNPAIVAYWQAGSHTHDGYESHLPSVMDFPLQEAVVNALNRDETWGAGLVELYQTLASDFVYGNPYNLVTFPDNHDMSRIFTQVGEDLALYKMAMIVFATTRGIPQIYYGTEILMTNPGTEDHGVIRTDFPGGWDGDKVNGFTGQGLSEHAHDAQQFTKALLNWRRGSSAVHSGKLTHYVPQNGVYVYFRQGGDDVVMVVINKNDKAITPRWTDFTEVLTGQTRALNVISGTDSSIQDVVIPANTAQVFELN